MNELTRIGDEIVASFLSIFDKIIDVIPGLIGAIVILLIGALVASLVFSLVHRLFRAIKLETLSKKLKVDEKIKAAGIESNVSRILAGLVYWLVLLVFISAAADSLNISALTAFINKLIGWLPSIFAGLAIMIVGVMVAEKLSHILSHVKHGATYKIVVRWFVLIVAFITAIEQIGIDISFLTENIQILVAGVALALGISFGLAGKEKAKSFLDKVWK